MSYDISYGHYIWSLHMVITYGHYIWSLHMVITYGHYIWSLHMVITRLMCCDGIVYDGASAVAPNMMLM